MENKFKKYLTDNRDKIDDVLRLYYELAKPFMDESYDIDDETQEKLGKIAAEFIIERCEVLFPDLL